MGEFGVVRLLLNNIPRYRELWPHLAGVSAILLRSVSWLGNCTMAVSCYFSARLAGKMSRSPRVANNSIGKNAGEEFRSLTEEGTFFVY